MSDITGTICERKSNFVRSLGFEDAVKQTSKVTHVVI